MEKNISFNLKKLENGKFKVIVKIPHSFGWIQDLRINFENSISSMSFPVNHKENVNEEAIFESEIELPESAIYRYYFSYYVNGKRLFIKNNDSNLETINKTEMFKMRNSRHVPDWALNGVVYHIFPDRFYSGGKKPQIEIPGRKFYSSFDEEPIVGIDENGNYNVDFYGGTLKGIEEKLDYIKSLGTTMIYLNPIVYAQSNHRYDTIDYDKVDPYLGTWEDLESLCKKAHEKGIRIIIDAVFNHTGNDSVYFNEHNRFNTEGAFQNPNSRYGKFYKKRTEGQDVRFNYWFGFHTLPECNGSSPEWIDFITGKNGVIDKWFSHGIDGLRLDVADGMEDSFIEKIREAVDRNNGFLVGEAWDKVTNGSKTFIDSGKGLHTNTNYYLEDALIRYFKYGDADCLEYRLNELFTEYPDETLLSNFNSTSTHDISRPPDIFGTDEFLRDSRWSWDPKSHDDHEYQRKRKLTEEERRKGIEKYKAYLFALGIMPGNLTIFYGDEAGVEGLGNEYNRKPFPWKNIRPDIYELVQRLANFRTNEELMKKVIPRVKEVNPNYFVLERVLGNSRLLTIVSRKKGGFMLIPPEYENPNQVIKLKTRNPYSLDEYDGIIIKKVGK